MYKILVTDGGYSHTLEIIRSFSKWAGIAGLRIGYMLANSEIIDNVFNKRPINSV